MSLKTNILQINEWKQFNVIFFMLKVLEFLISLPALYLFLINQFLVENLGTKHFPTSTMYIGDIKLS